jgi:DnaJ-class molecular chaperone
METDQATALAVLGLKPGAQWREIRQSYLDLVQVWHPDRFQHDPRLRHKAQQKLAEINAAFALLSSLQRTTSTSPRSGRHSTTTSKTEAGTHRSHEAGNPWAGITKERRFVIAVTLFGFAALVALIAIVLSVV